MRDEEVYRLPGRVLTIGNKNQEAIGSLQPHGFLRIDTPHPVELHLAGRHMAFIR